MPTKMGGYLNGLIFLMFLLSVGYNNNLLLIFTLFLFGLNLIWLIQTHFHLHRLKFDSIYIQDGHAEEATLVEINWSKAPEGELEWKLNLENKTESLSLVSLENKNLQASSQVIFPKRGVLNFEHLRVATHLPFGLYHTWAYYKIQGTAYVYPARLKKEALLTTQNSSHEGEQSTLKRGPHDIWNLAPYSGEESRKISWKHYARSGELVVKEGEDLHRPVMEFRYFPNQDNKEFYLSQIATQMVECNRNNSAFSLETPTRKFKLNTGEKHLMECLRELSQC